MPGYLQLPWFNLPLEISGQHHTTLELRTVAKIHPPPRLAAHGFLHLPAVRVGGIRRHEAFHATGLHRDDAHRDATQASAAHDDGLTPALQVPGLKGSLNSLVMD